MKNALPLKIMKGVFKINVKIFQFLLTNIILGSSSYDEEIEEFREWQEEWDEYRRAVNHYKSF
jgi:hypothetical protein